MVKVLEDIRTFIVEVIGLVGGLFWAIATHWDYEPIIVIALAVVGMTFFIIKRFLIDEDAPNVQMELRWTSTGRHPPAVIPGISPQDAEGYFLIHRGGTYAFPIHKKFDLIIRNNSKNNAYNLKLYRDTNPSQVTFSTIPNSLEPLVINIPVKILCNYSVLKQWTHDERDAHAEKHLAGDMNNLVLLAEYESESGRKYYSQLTPLNNNKRLKKVKLKEWVAITPVFTY